jgi:ABC-type polar amino acid transport system ATPase subunit
MIRIRGLRKRFGARIALDGVDGDVAEGECVAIVGASGCGKSTLLRCLNAMTAIDGGTIDIAGHAISPAAPADRQALCAAVGMVFQEWNLFPHLTALENVALAPRIVARLARPEAERRARELLSRVGLADRAASRPGQLSGGQKQRVAIARAMAMPLRVLLLDEPTSALDPAMREEVRDVVRSVARESGLTMVLVTHEMRLAAELATRVWSMKEGRVVATGTPREVLGASSP